MPLNGKARLQSLNVSNGNFRGLKTNDTTSIKKVLKIEFIISNCEKSLLNPQHIIELARELSRECNGIGYEFLDDSGEQIGHFHDIVREQPESDPIFYEEGPIRFIRIDYLTMDEHGEFTTTRILYRIHYRNGHA